jgi:hypothetical protein
VLIWCTIEPRGGEAELAETAGVATRVGALSGGAVGAAGVPDCGVGWMMRRVEGARHWLRVSARPTNRKEHGEVDNQSDQSENAEPEDPAPNGWDSSWYDTSTAPGVAPPTVTPAFCRTWVTSVSLPARDE